MPTTPQADTLRFGQPIRAGIPVADAVISGGS